MSVHLISADEAMARYDQFDAVIDARSEGEHAEDHLPGALNWPSLNNEERIRVGTLYKQVSPFEAQKIGAAHLIEGGYKAFRKAVIEDTPRRVQPLQFQVLCGPTGSGKTRLLQALAAQGAQVLDLEAIASHRASVLGVIPGQPQPSQKAFETRLWNALRRFDPSRPVLVEAESKKVGNLTIPDSVMAAMRASACVRLALSLQGRVQLLMEDYDYFVKDTAYFCDRLERLADLKGRSVIEDWKARVQAGQTREVVAELLEKHYDPGYETSTARNFRHYAQAPVLQLTGPDHKAMADAARQWLNQPTQAS